MYYNLIKLNCKEYHKICKEKCVEIFSLKKINVYKNTTTINAEKRYMVKNGRYIL